MKRLSLSLLLAILTACGARSALDPHEDPDSVDGGTPDSFVPDGFTPDVSRPDTSIPDAGPDTFDAGPPDIEMQCSEPQMVRPGQIARITAVPIGDFAPPVGGRWVQVELMGAEIMDPSAAATGVSSDVGGRHVFEFTAMDANGGVGRCRAVVAVVNGPPIASCPVMEVTGPAGMPLTVEAQGFDDDGIVSTRWSLVEGDLDIFEPDSPITTVRSPNARAHRMLFTVTDTDGATDSCIADVRTTAPPVLDCPPPFMAPTRVPIQVEVSGRDDTRIVRHIWTAVSWPPEDDDGLLLTRTRRNRTTIVPDRQGRYVMNYVATDSDGLSSSCEVIVIGIPTPPTLVCPLEVRIPPLETGSIETSWEDDGRVVRWNWELTGRPDGSAADAPSPAAAITMFSPDIAGRYAVRLTVTDDDGMTASCDIPVLASNDQGLRIEVSWDSATDMDTHLLNPLANRWAGNDDCSFRNCIPRGAGGTPVLSWGTGGFEDDPTLDLDNTRGFGPENINIEEPGNGVYRAGVHAFRGTSRVTMRIYCGGSRLDPVATFGPVTVPDGAIWRVADIEIDGLSCDVREVRTGDGGLYISPDDSMR